MPGIDVRQLGMHLSPARGHQGLAVGDSLRDRRISEEPFGRLAGARQLAHMRLQGGPAIDAVDGHAVGEDPPPTLGCALVPIRSRRMAFPFRIAVAPPERLLAGPGGRASAAAHLSATAPMPSRGRRYHRREPPRGERTRV